MISDISKKIIITSLLFINFTQPSKSANLEKINRNENNLKIKLSSLKIPYSEYSINLLNLPYKKDLEEILFEKKLLYQSKANLAFISEKNNEIVIQSDKQSEINDVIYAEGNVSVSYRGKLLKADNLTYDKSNKEISAKGNVILIIGDQVFKVSQLQYSFISKKGYLLNIKGSINTNTLIDDLSSNFSI